MAAFPFQHTTHSLFDEDVGRLGHTSPTLEVAFKDLLRNMFPSCTESGKHCRIVAPSPAISNRRHCQKKAPPDCTGPPSLSSLAHLGSGSLPFLCARHGSRAVGPPPTTHQSGPPCRLQRRTDAISPFRGPHHGRGQHSWPHCLLDCQCTALRKKDGSHRPVAVGETLRRLTAKVLLAIVSEHTTALRPAQLGFGTKSDCEAIIHAIRRWGRKPQQGRKTVLLDDGVGERLQPN